MFSDSGYASPHADLTASISGGNVYFTVPTAQKNTAQTVTFYFRLNINSGEYYHDVDYSSSATFTLVVKCGTKSSINDADIGTFAGGLSSTQYVPRNDPTKTYFELPSYVLDNPSCGITANLVSSTRYSFNSFTGEVNDAVEVPAGSGKWRIVPVNIDKSDVYDFYMYPVLGGWGGRHFESI